MMDSSGKAIFFAELDDDYQDFRKLTEYELLQRTYCYYLLAPSIIIHPAYIWQSTIAHRLLSGPVGGLLRPPFANLELGNYESINDYMTRRIERLAKAANPTREFRQYESHGQSLFDEAKTLDARFESAVSRPVSVTLRDKRFRNLLYGDLGATDLDRLSLGTLLGAFREEPLDGVPGRDFTERMQRFVRTANLVSVDTFRARIYNTGYSELEESNNLRRRLLALYYQTYADERTVIPATSKLLFGQVVNIYDSDVFWNVMNRMFGSGCHALMKNDSEEVVSALRAIRESPDWSSFVAMYFDTLSTIDEALWAQPLEVIKAFDKHRPQRSQMFILKRLWQRKKIDLSAAAFGAVALSSATSFSSVPEWTAGTAGITSVGFGAFGVIRSVANFVKEYKEQEVVRIKDAVRQRVERALSDIRRKGAGLED
jgi:hypothetical protein